MICTLAGINWRTFWELSQCCRDLSPWQSWENCLTPGLALMAFFPPLLSCIRSQCLMSPSSSELPLKLHWTHSFLLPMLTARTEVPLPIPWIFSSPLTALLVLARGDSSWLVMLGSRMRRAHGSGQAEDVILGLLKGPNLSPPQSF